jgi:hypothetical protein
MKNKRMEIAYNLLKMLLKKFVVLEYITEKKM